jgi:hypothetical protein
MVFTFTAKGNNTLVRLSQTGWQGGKEWDAAYEYLAAGNITNQSPPFLRSTDTSGASQLLKPSLVVNALQTSGSGAGMDISMINACVASAGKT